MKPLILVGYMGCGKSSLGRKLARRLGVRFVDTDSLIEERERTSIADLFTYIDEQSFRRMEREVLDQVIRQGNGGVISTGGGLPLWADNMEVMNRAGITVYLRRDPVQIAGRLTPYGRQKRPRLRGLSDSELADFMTRDMALREPFYLQAAIAIDCTGMADDLVVERIMVLSSNPEIATPEKANTTDE